MKSISISNLSKETLENVNEIYASLESGGIASVASKPITPFVLDRPEKEIPASVSITLMRDDRSPFSNIEEARQALQQQPTRSVLSDTEFTTNPSANAEKFLVEYKKIMGETHHNPINKVTVIRIARAAELNTEQLDSVLIELDGRKIDVHDGGMISLRPPGF